VSGRIVTVSANGVRMPVAGARLAALATDVLRAERVTRADISVTCVLPREMARLNRTHLGHAGPTDVITFALGRRADGVLEADVYLCPAVAREQAGAHGVGVREGFTPAAGSIRKTMHARRRRCGDARSSS